jgi:hypothetical protein
MPFQRQVNTYQAPGVAGDFASANVRTSVLSTEGGLVTGSGGVFIGRFAWVAPDNITTRSYGTYNRQPDGFVHREQQGIITAFLGEATTLVREGNPVTLHNRGDFWALVAGSVAPVRDMPVYADYSDGSILFGSPPVGATATGSLGATTTSTVGATFTATGSGLNLTTTSVTGLISIGDTISGVGVPAGTTITGQVSGTTGGAGVYTTSVATTASAATVTAFGTVLNVTVLGGGYVSAGDTVSLATGGVISAQLTGTAGGVGTYRLSTPVTAYTASGTVTTFGNIINVTAVGSGTLKPGVPVTGTGIPANSVIVSQNTGITGGAGMYRISNNGSAYAASTALTTVGGVLTDWKAAGSAAVGELVKITRWS